MKMEAETGRSAAIQDREADVARSTRLSALVTPAEAEAIAARASAAGVSVSDFLRRQALVAVVSAEEEAAMHAFDAMLGQIVRDTEGAVAALSAGIERFGT